MTIIESLTIQQTPPPLQSSRSERKIRYGKFAKISELGIFAVSHVSVINRKSGL